MRPTDEQIGTGLRALRPAPSGAFAARLDQRAAAGFADHTRSEASRSALRRRLLPGLAAAAAIGIVAVVISSTGGEGDRSTGTTSVVAPSAGSGGAPAAQSATRAGVPRDTVESLPPIAPPIPGRPYDGQTQVQELSASLGLSTDPGKLQDAADGVVRVANRYGGFVDSSSVHATGGSDSHASFSLRIPALHLRDALTDLSALGRVTSRDEGSSNVTGAYTDAGKRYRDARATVASLLDQLRKASNPARVASLRQQLVAARAQLAASRAALRGVKQRVAYAPVSVEISAAGDGGWSMGDAADDAGKVLVAIGGALLIALAVLIPLVILLTLGWLGARELQRRRREAPLNR